jgi:hypothetical protein
MTTIAEMVQAAKVSWAQWKEQRLGLRRKRMKAQAEKRLERYGLDVIGPDGRIDPETRRVMRNARKAERQLPPPRFAAPGARAAGCSRAKALAGSGKRPRFILRNHAATCDGCREAGMLAKR